VDSSKASVVGDDNASIPAYIPLRVVLDSNIVIDLLHFADPSTHWLREAIAAGSVRCFSTSECVDELASVLPRPQFRLDGAAVGRVLAAYAAIVTLVDETSQPLAAATIDAIPRCRDRDDQKFLVLAARCRADLLITRDRELLRLARPGRRPAPCAILSASAAESWQQNWQENWQENWQKQAAPAGSSAAV
jgi:putative PIN family toxin of toxin-antitoxin system